MTRLGDAPTGALPEPSRRAVDPSSELALAPAMALLLLYFYCLGQGGSAKTGCREPSILAGDAETHEWRPG
jgi:hypothetical protein